MTEQKKDYILNALSEMEDSFIEEAAEYQKPKFVWRYTKELMAAAACIAVLFISVNAISLLPIGGSKDMAANEAAPESMQDVGMNKSEGMPTAGENENIEYKAEATVEAEITLENSIGIIVEEIEATEEVSKEDGAVNVEETDGTGGYPQLETMQVTSCVEWLSAEELLALDTDIFMGEVLDISSYKVSGGLETYFSIALVEVTDSIRSHMESGSLCRIYLPTASVDGNAVTNSVAGDLDKLKKGSRAIFMPYKTTEESAAEIKVTGKETVAARLSYSDFADYYFGEGMRFLFLEKGDELLFEESVYKVPNGKNASLEEAAEYLRKVLKEIHGE